MLRHAYSAHVSRRIAANVLKDVLLKYSLVGAARYTSIDKHAVLLTKMPSRDTRVVTRLLVYMKRLPIYMYMCMNALLR